MLIITYSYLFLAFSLISFCSSSLLLETKSISLELTTTSINISNPFSISVDFISLTFFFVVCLISSIVFLYSNFYIDQQWQNNINNSYFFVLIILFVISMIILIFSNSWVMLIVGWDGLGITSFLLVIFYNNKSSLDSGILTVLSNRVGDCLFILTFMVIYHSGWFNWNFMNFSENFTLFSIIIAIGAVTNSAQFPFSSWLPAAIAAPTPVSSLVHSSTLVTAGVFVILRFNYLIYSCFNYLAFISLLTIVLGGACAINELDFNNVVAISTLSQLGFIIFSITIGYWIVSFFHIVFHAFFNSSLFLATGNLIHLLSSDQESRSFGGMGGSLFSSVHFTLSAVSLMGFPFSLGFYSNDTTLGLTSSLENSINSTLFILGCCFTVAYSCRLVYISFFNSPNSFTCVIHNEVAFFFSPLTPIFICCVLVGNFFFYTFFPPLSLSLTDVSVGLTIIFSGIVVFSVLDTNNIFTWNFLTTLANITPLTNMLSLVVENSPSNIDPSWLEISSSSGVNNIITSLPSMVNFTFKTNIWIPITLLLSLLLINTA